MTLLNLLTLLNKVQQCISDILSKNSILFLLVWVFIRCTSQAPPKLTQIEVQQNVNIHLHLILEHLVNPRDYNNRPIITIAQEYFSGFTQHPAVRLTDSLLNHEVFYSDELMEVLLYSEPLPDLGYQHSLENTPYEERAELIEDWKSNVAEFYVESDFESFMEICAPFYEGVIAEVKANLPEPGFVEQMEKFYKDEKESYTIIPAPEMATGHQRGVGPYVRTGVGMKVYQIISASIPVPLESNIQNYAHFGFDDNEFILTNSRHEFGHSFVNSILEQQKFIELIGSYEFLFVPGLKEVMADQGYSTWWDCVAEHLVRLGEIRIAARNNELELVSQLEVEYIEQRQFLFIPDLDEKIRKYEDNLAWPSFESFLPELLSIFEHLTPEEVNRRIKTIQRE